MLFLVWIIMKEKKNGKSQNFIKSVFRNMISFIRLIVLSFSRVRFWRSFIHESDFRFYLNIKEQSICYSKYRFSRDKL